MNPSDDELVDIFATIDAPEDDMDIEEVGDEVVIDFNNEDDGQITLEELPQGFFDHNANLAFFLPDEELLRVGSYCHQRFEQDKTSLDEYYRQINKGIKRLGLTIEELNEPFPGAASVTHPIVMESALKTQAKIMGEVFNGKGIVDTYFKGDRTEETLDTANRVKNHMDYQLLFEMKEYVRETERLTFRFALTGNAFRKFYYCPIRDRIRSTYVTEDKFICNMSNTSLEDADFHTEIISMKQHEFRHLINLEEFVNVLDSENGKLAAPEFKYTAVDDAINIETSEPMGEINSRDMEVYELYEHHAYFAFPDPYNDGETRPLPYVITTEASTQKVVSIRRNWKKDDEKKLKRNWYAHYCLIPGLGFMGMGYVHILSNFQYALTQIQRSLLDAGQFANLKGGFKAKSMGRFQRDSGIPVKMGEWREIDTGSRPIRDVLMPLEYGEPSQVLERLLTTLSSMAQKFADSTEAVISDSTNYGPVGTTIALLEASGKFISGIQKRFYQGLQQEFEILYDLNYDIMDEEVVVYRRDAAITVKREDYSGVVGIMPLADPNVSSSAHRIALAQTKLQAAQQNPNIHNMREAYVGFYGAIGMEKPEIDRLLPQQEEAQPQDPLTDIQALAAGKPIKAFPGQDHQAHIRFKNAFLNDPMGGSSEAAKGIVPLIQANIAEHQLLLYVASVQAQGGDASMAGNEMDVALAAERAKEANSIATNIDALKEGDVETMLGVAELLNAKTREMDVKFRVEKDKVKLALENRKLGIEEKKIEAGTQNTIIKTAADLEKQKTDLTSKMMMQGMQNIIDSGDGVD